MGRRAFLAGAAGVLGAAALRGPAWAQDPEPPALPVPPLLDARREGNALSLVAQAGETAFFPGRPAPSAGYNGAYLGPTLRMHSGDEVEVATTNRLHEETTVHWHGLLVPSEVDGGPHNVIAPGGTWRPVLPVRQPAATVWYHAHPHPRTGPQVYSGLAGLLIVTDAAEQALGLPSEYGVDDLPLVLQDRLFDGAGRLVYPLNPMTRMQGVRGDVVLVNGGAPSPVARPPAGLVRLRLVNGSNARIYDLSFGDGRAFHWIGTEGGLLRRPVRLKGLTLAPGQRAELLADFSDGRPVDLVSAPDANFPRMGMMGRGMGRMGGGDAGPLRVMSFQPRGAARPAAVAPRTLAAWTRPSAAGARRRRLNLTMGMMGRGMGGGGRGMGGMHGLHGIDGRAFDIDRIDQRVRLGDTEIWEVSGEAMRHPFHMHGVHFEVLSRGGGPPAPEDQGLRDTVLVEEPVELLVRFTQPAAKFPFMYHCHIFEHEDHGMMGQYLTD